jgi:hypothetical protein
MTTNIGACISYQTVFIERKEKENAGSGNTFSET